MTLEEQIAEHSATIESKDLELAAANELLEGASAERDEAVAALEAKDEELKASAEKRKEQAVKDLLLADGAGQSPRACC